jgi:hypothetical protein
MQEGDETERGEERKGEGDRRDLREGKAEREKSCSRSEPEAEENNCPYDFGDGCICK